MINPESVRIAIIGDSTVSDYPSGSIRWGWGQALPALLTPETRVLNEAEPGRSTKTFPQERWKAVLAFHPNFVLIQFGHNDSHAKDLLEATDAATDFRENLRRYIWEAREGGVIPVLVTPVHRRLFADGHPTEELRAYAEAMRVVSVEMGVPLLDLYARSGDLFDRLGEMATQDFTINATDNADRPGAEDRSHFTVSGAQKIARLVSEAFASIDPRLAAAVKPPATQ